MYCMQIWTSVKVYRVFYFYKAIYASKCRAIARSELDQSVLTEVRFWAGQRVQETLECGSAGRNMLKGHNRRRFKLKSLFQINKRTKEINQTAKSAQVCGALIRGSASMSSAQSSYTVPLTKMHTWCCTQFTHSDQMRVWSDRYANDEISRFTIISDNTQPW